MSDDVLNSDMFDDQDVSIDELLLQDDELLEEDLEEYGYSGKTPNLYRGKAFNGEELYCMTAGQESQLILVAGMFHSGKTTMEMAIYQMFLRGVNKKLKFAGSRTLVDVAERSQDMRAVSDNSEHETARTSSAVSDIFLHIAVMDENQKKHNLVFPDLAGEVFKLENAEKNENILKQFIGVRQVIVLVDGEKLSGREKNKALLDSKNMITLLLQQGIISDHTRVHLVYSKNDMILSSSNPQLEEAINRNNDKVRAMLGEKQVNLRIHRISAISSRTEKTANFEGLEELLEACLENLEYNQGSRIDPQAVYADRTWVRSSFDQFAWKG